MIRDPPKLGLGTVKNRQDQSCFGGFNRAGQRGGAAGMHNAGQHRLEVPAALDKLVQTMLRHLDLLPCCRRHDLQNRRCNDLTRWAGALTVQQDGSPIRPLLPHNKTRRHRHVDRQLAHDLDRGRADRGSWPWQRRTDQCGQDGRDDPGNHLALIRTGERANFAEGGGPGSHVADLKNAFDGRGVAWNDFIECLVYNGPHGSISERSRSSGGGARPETTQPYPPAGERHQSVVRDACSRIRR